MLVVKTKFGFGYVIPKALVPKDADKSEYRKLLHPMCHSCGQTPYFFGFIEQEVSSKQAYVKWNGTIPYFDFEQYQRMCDTLQDGYKDMFGIPAKEKPDYIMFTDIIRE